MPDWSDFRGDMKLADTLQLLTLKSETSSPSLFHAVTLEHFLYMPPQMNSPTLTHLSCILSLFWQPQR